MRQRFVHQQWAAARMQEGFVHQQKLAAAMREGFVVQQRTTNLRFFFVIHSERGEILEKKAFGEAFFIPP